MELPRYTTGTASIALNGTSFVGSSTIWSDINAREGDWVRDPATGYTTVVLSRTDATHLVVPPWRSTALVNAGYEIYPYSPLRFAGGTAMADVEALLAILNGATIFYQVTGSAPDDSLGEDGNIAIKVNASPWQQWIKSSGVWVSQGTPIGISNKGAWSGATAYAVNDVVSSGGNAYLCITPNANQVPPNGTYWTLLGAKGDPGATGGTGPAGTIAIGTVTTGAAGSSATVTNSGSSSAATLNFAIPQGNQGTQGIQGIQGATPVISGTSASVVAVGSGSKTFTTQAGIAWLAGMRLRAYNAGGDRVMAGIITSYSGTALTMNVDTFQGVGIDNNWTINISGERGQDGGPGPQGAASSVPGPQGAASTVPGPQGIQGNTGAGIQPDATGNLAQRALYDNQAIGFKFLQTDTSPFRLWAKASNTSADWAGPSYVGGVAAINDLGSVADSVLETFDYGVAA